MSGRIPRVFIDDLLARTDLVDLISTRVPLRKSGGNFVACCPFHTEKSPSFTVSPAKQIFHCFGCGASGNAIGFVMDFDRLSFVEAIESLAGHYGITVPREDTGKPEQKRDNHQELHDILEKACRYFQQQLKNSPAAIQYLKQRGLTGEIAKNYRIGFVPSGWDNILRAVGNNQPAKINDLLATGLLIKKNNEGYYDRFRERIMFPIRDKAGKLIGFGGRVLDNSTPKYLNSPETALFHKGRELYGLYEARLANREISQIIVVEGYMDVIALAQVGITNAVATLGTATTTQHLQQLLRQTNKIIFCFDGDTAGKTAAWRALEITLPVIQEGSFIHFLFLPEGEDPDSLVRKETAAGFLQRLGQAVSLPDFLLNTLSAQVDMSQIEGRARFTKLALPLINKIASPILQEMMFDKLAEMVRLDRDRLISFANSDFTPQRAKVETNSRQKKATAITQMSPMRLAIALVLQHPYLAGEIADMSGLLALTLAGAPLLCQLLTILKSQPQLNTGALVEYWRDEDEYVLLLKLAAWEINIPSSGIAAEFHGIVQRLNNLQREYQIDQLLQKAQQADLSIIEKELLQKLIAGK